MWAKDDTRCTAKDPSNPILSRALFEVNAWLSQPTLIGRMLWEAAFCSGAQISPADATEARISQMVNSFSTESVLAMSEAYIKRIFVSFYQNQQQIFCCITIVSCFWWIISINLKYISYIVCGLCFSAHLLVFSSTIIHHNEPRFYYIGVRAK